MPYIWRNFGNLTLMSIATFLAMLAFGTSSIFITKMLKETDMHTLGFLSITIVFIVYTFSSFFSTAIINKIGRLNISLSIGSFGYAIFTAGFLLPAYMAKKMSEHPEGLAP